MIRLVHLENPPKPKRKRVPIRLIQPENAGKVTEPYAMLEARIAKFRPDLRKVKIGMAWHVGWRPDADGILAIGSGGQCALAAARALMGHSELTAAQVVETALKIAGEINIYSNQAITVEVL